MAVFTISDKRSARKCTECGARNMSVAGGDVFGGSRWLCRDCKHRYAADYRKSMGRPMPRQVLLDMLRH